VRGTKVDFPGALKYQECHIDELPRDFLDPLVCIYVLGWKIGQHPPDHHFGGDFGFSVFGMNPKGQEVSVPKITGSLYVATRIIDVMADQGIEMKLQFSGGRWYAWFLSKHPFRTEAEDESLPVALARASLKAVLGRTSVELPADLPRKYPDPVIPKSFVTKHVTHMRIILEDK
jgi:hypothetical protein